LAIALTFYLLLERPGVLGALLLAIPLAMTVMTWLPDTAEDFVKNLIITTDTDLRSKFYVWNCAFDALGKYVWTGIGVGESALASAWQGFAAVVPSGDQFFNLYITAILQLGVAGITVLVVMLVLALQKGFAVLMQTKKGTYFRKASALSLTALIALLVFGLGDSLFYSVQLFLLLLLCVGFVRIVFSIYTVQLMAKEEDAGLDIDLDTERKVKSDNKLLINLCELAVKLVKKIIKLVKKIIKAVKNRKNVPKKKALKKDKKRSEKKVVIPTEASEVVITDENTYEEESTCQEK
jgi:hypothetical protein